MGFKRFIEIFKFYSKNNIKIQPRESNVEISGQTLITKTFYKKAFGDAPNTITFLKYT